MLFFSHNFFVVFLLITAIYGPILLLYVFWSFFKTELSYFHSPEYFVGLLSGQVHIGNLDNALYTSPSQQLFHWYIIGWIFFNQTMWNSLLTTAQWNNVKVIVNNYTIKQVPRVEVTVVQTVGYLQAKKDVS